MTRPHDSPAATVQGPGHDEWLIDQSLQETFPASDPTTPVRPGSTVGLRYPAADHSGFAAQAMRSPLTWVLIGCLGVCLASLYSSREKS